MTPSELKHAVNQAGHESHFFDRDAMKFFGDTMKNYGVRSVSITSDYDADGNYAKAGARLECWELYRRRAVKHGLKSSHYFAKASLRKVFPTREAGQ